MLEQVATEILRCTVHQRHVELVQRPIIGIDHLDQISSSTHFSSHVLIPASWSRLRREADACVSTQLTGANQAPIVARGVDRSFRAHHIDAALGLESDGMLRSHARY